MEIQSQEELYSFQDEAPERKYFTQIPNLVDDLGLSPFAKSLYMHIKRRTGEAWGKPCFEGTRSIASHCKMSLGMVSQAKKELLQCNPPLIRIEKKKCKGGYYDSITILDIWAVNIARYEQQAALKRAEQEQQSDLLLELESVHPVNANQESVHHVNTKPESVHTVNTNPPKRSPSERKNIVNNNLIKEPIYSPIGEEESSSSSLLEAKTKYGLRLMEVLTEEARAKRGGPVRKFKRFKSLAMKQMFENSEQRLGEQTEEAIAAAMRAGCTSIKAAVYYIAAFGKNGHSSKVKSSMIPAQSKPASDQEVEEEFRRLNPGVQLPGVLS